MRTLVLFLSITGCLSMTCHQIRTVYNDHSCCRDSPTDTCLRTMPVCNETSNTSICTEAGIPTIKVDNTTIFLNENGTLYTTGNSGVTSYNDLTDKPEPYTLPSDLTTFDASLQVAGSKFGLGTSPEASFHIGLSENVDVNVSRFECDGSGAIIEQTSGELTAVMSQSDCSVLVNYSATVPNVSAVKKYDGYCSTSTSNSPYNYNVLVQNTGSHAGGSKHLTFAECKMYGLTTSGYSWATDSGNDAGTYNTTYNPPGCQSYGSTNLVYYNTNLQSTTGCDSTQKCLLKLNVKEVSSGTPPNDLSEAECKAYGESIGKWKSASTWGHVPLGCWKWTNDEIYYNLQTTTVTCGETYKCLSKDTTYDNPGTTDQQRIDACRDACTNRSIPLFSGSWDFRSASLWVEPTGGECHCGAEPAGTCATTASDFIDLYELNNPPKGCFRDSSGNHYHNNPSDDNYGVCSTNYKCLRNDKGCLVQDINNETKSISLISEQSAWFKNEIIVSSDQRIKTNITHVDNALSILRDIPTRYYDYVDHRRGSSTIGFLAQEVAQVLPSAVKKQRGYIPSHMKRITCVFDYTDALRIHCPELDDDKKYKLYVSNPNEGEKAVEIRNHGVIDKVYASIYCFGEEVEDFHVLEKSKLFAIAFSATQELDKLVSTLRQEVDELKAKVYGTV